MLQGADHYATHMSGDDDVVDAALRTRRPGAWRHAAKHSPGTPTPAAAGGHRGGFPLWRQLAQYVELYAPPRRREKPRR